VQEPQREFPPVMTHVVPVHPIILQVPLRERIIHDPLPPADDEMRPVSPARNTGPLTARDVPPTLVQERVYVVVQPSREKESTEPQEPPVQAQRPPSPSSAPREIKTSDEEEKSSEGKKKVPKGGSEDTSSPGQIPPRVPSADPSPSQSKQPESEVGSSDKLKVYNGTGRRHTDDQIDEILDEYLMSGNLPKYVSERQRRDYRKHKRLELRRMYLEQAGIQTIPGAKEDSGNALRMAEAKAQREKRSS
jgi:hypothetical protein